MIDYLCPEGQRLWDEWDKLRNFDYIVNPTWEGINLANTAWTAYQDHRAACQECDPLTRFKKSGII